MEGVNIGGILLGYLGVLVFGVVSLVALGLLIARLVKPAMIVFAAGWLAAAGILGLATLSFLDRQFHPDGNEVLIVLAALSMLTAAAGQFVASLRSGRAYGAAVGCAAAAMLVLTAGMMGGTDMLYLGGFGQVLAGNHIVMAAASLALAVASLAVATFVPWVPRSAPQTPRRG